MARALLLFAVTWLATPSLPAEDWLTWRGPHGDGHAAGTGFPLQWSATENVLWKTPLPGPGNSTPVITNNRVFVSASSNTGQLRSLICFDLQTGNQLWQRDVDYTEPEPSHPNNPRCSSSPVTDGQCVVVWHGSAGVFAYDLDGNLLWQRDLGKFQHIWGNGSSPVIYRDLVILNAGPGLSAFVVGLDKHTGTDAWRRSFPEMVSQKIDEFRGSWSSPAVATIEDNDLLLLSLPMRLHALDPLSGSDIWSCDGLGTISYTSPLATPAAIVAMSGYHGPAMGVRPGGRGNVTDTHRLWIHDEAPPQRVGSGIVVDQYAYILNEPGIAWCIEVTSGEVLWKHRLSDVPSWSSFCYADGRLYVNNMAGTTYVLKPDPTECLIEAKNPLDEPMRASLAFSDGRILIRTYEHLYCIGERLTSNVQPVGRTPNIPHPTSNLGR